METPIQVQLGSVMHVTSDMVPVEAEPPISEEVRQRGLAFLQGLFADGDVDVDRFRHALDRLLGAHTEAEFGEVIRSLPSPVARTPPPRRRQDPFDISTSMGGVRLHGRWQVSRLTTIHSGMGAVVVDLCDAEFDELDVEIVVHTGMGAITVICPPGLDLRLEGQNGTVTSHVEPPIPGFPVVRLSVTSDMGAIRIVHPGEQASKRRGWRRRRLPAVHS